MCMWIQIYWSTFIVLCPQPNHAPHLGAEWTAPLQHPLCGGEQRSTWLQGMVAQAQVNPVQVKHLLQVKHLKTTATPKPRPHRMMHPEPQVDATVGGGQE